LGELLDLEAQGKREKGRSQRKEIGATGAADTDVMETVGTRRPEERQMQQKKTQEVQQEQDDGWDFGDDDSSLLDLISSFGQEDIRQVDPEPKKGGKKK
jgi:hypothetical protein